jgi:hypothetical protein
MILIRFCSVLEASRFLYRWKAGCSCRIVPAFVVWVFFGPVGFASDC